MTSRADTEPPSPTPTWRDESAASAVPVYVDLDGSLIASDVLWESLCRLLSQQPTALPGALAALSSGRAAFKRHIVERVAPDERRLPYRPEVLAYLEGQRAAGRRIVLATASDERIATAIADHLDLFDEVLASDGESNLKGEAKLAAILDREGSGPFEYIGDSSADLAIWRGSSAATLVAASPATRRAVERLGVPVEVLVEPAPRFRTALRALRPYQWIKNALLFVPFVLAHELEDPGRGLGVALAFVAFCCVASATYLWNDLLDIEADRLHPRKSQRPFAAGTLSIPFGAALSFGLLAVGFGVSGSATPPAATGMLALYLVTTTSYSFYFKEQLFLDVLVLAGLYTLRVLAGGVAADVPVSPWLLAFSLFFFLSLAFVKRYAELLGAQASDQERLERRGYEVGDIGLVETMGTTSGYLSVLVLALYVNGAGATGLYQDTTALWAVCPIMLFWITRIWFLARRGTLRDDPVLFAATDPVSYLSGAALVLAGVVAAFS